MRDGDQGGGERIPIFRGGVPVGAKSEGAAHLVEIETHGTEGERRLAFSRAAGCSGGGLEPEASEAGDPAEVSVVGHDQEGGIPKAFGLTSRHESARDSGEDFGLEAVPGGGGGSSEIFREREGRLEGGDHGGDSGEVFGPSASVPLLGSAGQDAKVGRLGNHEEADAFCPSEFVGAAGDEAAAAEVGSRELPEPLGGIAVERNPELGAEVADLRPGLEDAGLVVGGHDRDEGGPGCGEHVAEGIGGDGAGAAGGNQLGRGSEKLAGGFEDAGVFDSADEDLRSGVGSGEMGEDGVVGFGGARG